ncbi:MAG: tRNA epoxyqueuosine(34) reductase QueG [Gammaproteobacteria bacterium]|nr:tRNA epoxyqueuosine(34) reductase QueG [Gammaproteobacteria bacterium]
MNSPKQLTDKIKAIAKSLGFDECGVTQSNLKHHIEHYHQWLNNQFHGDMSYMENNKELRENPAQLHPGTLYVISVRLNYVSSPAKFTNTLVDSDKANISRYALGRDYHKLMRKKLTTLGNEIQNLGIQHNSRAFVDSAPVLERAFAEQAGLGWIGKNSMLLNEESGSFFFLGELFTDLTLIPDNLKPNQCGACRSCLNFCPTGAIVEPYQVDARRCISYLTIEHHGAIPIELRSKFGNRIYGCDDCQLVCPFNRESQSTKESDFKPRHSLDDITLLELFQWSESQFLINFEGSPIRRIGYEKWIRNIAIALGNASYHKSKLEKLQEKLNEPLSDMVKEHIQWAINQLNKRKKEIKTVENNSLAKLIRTTKKIVSHLD